MDARHDFYLLYPVTEIKRGGQSVGQSRIWERMGSMRECCEHARVIGIKRERERDWEGDSGEAITRMKMILHDRGDRE